MKKEEKKKKEMGGSISDALADIRKKFGKESVMTLDQAWLGYHTGTVKSKEGHVHAYCA